MLNKDDLLGKVFLGIVEAIDINGDGITGKKKGRVKARIERFHGKKGEPNSIPTADIPWANPTLDGRGNTFLTPALEKVVRITFLEGDYYKPIYNSAEHYNFNLQEKLNSLSEDAYKDFYAVTYDDKHQYFHDKEMGVMFDYVKSNFNIDPDGNMALNLRDNKAKLYLGTDEAYERIMLGEKWLKWFDTLVENLMGSKGGPYLGNLGAPVIPNPGLLQCLNEYLTHRKVKDTFLSDHVYVVDDKQVKAQTRKFDKAQLGDTWNSKYEEKKKTPEERGYTPEERPPAAETGKGVPGTNISKNLANSNLPPNPTNEELQKTVKPFDGNENGRLDVNQLTISKYAQKAFPDGEQKYLVDEVATSLDKWLDSYHSSKQSSWSNITISKGYQNYERQQNIREQFGPRSPEPGKDPFGFANQVELYWGVDLTKNASTEPLTKYLNDGIVTDNTNVKILDWLVKNGKTYKWRLAGRDGDGNQQFSHWIYDASIVPTTPPANTTGDEVFRGGGYYFKVEKQGPKNRIVAYKESDNTIAKTGEYSFAASVQVLIDEMKIILNISDSSQTKATNTSSSTYNILNRTQISRLSDSELENRFQQNLLDTDKLTNDMNAGTITEEFYEKTLTSLEEERRMIESEKSDRAENNLL